MYYLALLYSQYAGVSIVFFSKLHFSKIKKSLHKNGKADKIKTILNSFATKHFLEHIGFYALRRFAEAVYTACYPRSGDALGRPDQTAKSRPAAKMKNVLPAENFLLTIRRDVCIILKKR